MGSKNKTPSPTAQAAAQTQADKQTSYYNAQLANMDQYTPYGSLTYQNLGTVDNPKWTSTVSLSPEQQQLYNTTAQSQNALATLGNEQIGRIRDSVSNPYSYENIGYAMPSAGDIGTQQSNAEAAYLARLEPQWARDEEALRTRLINQGIGQGSQAYMNEMNSFNQRKNDAMSQAVLAGQTYGTNAANQQLALRNQAINEYNTVRNAPLNEYTAMTSGTQIQNPTFSSGGNTGIQSPDLIGAYGAQTAQNNNQSQAMSNLFGLGGNALGTYLGGTTGGAAGNFLGSAVGSLFSDARVKENIVRVGQENGYPMYLFNYIGMPNRKFVGVMAQDVLKYMPSAVSEENGIMKVDYNKIGVSMKEIN